MSSKKPTFTAGMTAATGINTIPQKTLLETNAKREYNLQFVPKDKIIPNEKNKKYPQDSLESLKESIRLEGLRHNLCAMFDASSDTYRLVSGERRFRAICLLEPEDYSRLFPAGIPVKIEKSNISEVDEEIMLIKANAEIREETPELKRWEVLRLNELYEIKRNNGEEVPNIAKAISETLGMGERMTKNYLATKNLIPELSEILDNKGIAITEATIIAGLSEEAQRQILSLISQTGSIDRTEIEALKTAEKEKKALEKELLATQKKLEEKSVRIHLLESQISASEKSEDTSLSNEKNIEEEVEELRKEKDFAEKERQKLEERVRKLQEHQKERENRNITVSEDELKRLSAIAKIEQILTSLENEVSSLKTNKTILLEDISLRERTKLVAERLSKLLS